MKRLAFTLLVLAPLALLAASSFAPNRRLWFQPVASGGAFDPDSLSGAVTLLKNTSLTGSVFSFWVDSSGNGKHMTNTTSSTSPAISTALENGKDAVTFDTANDFLRSEADLTVPYTIAVVGYTTSAGTSDRRMLCSADGVNNRVVSLNRSASGLNSVYLGSTVATFAPPTSKAQICVLTVGSGGALFWVNGTNRTTFTGVSANFPKLAMGSIGVFGEVSGQSVFELRAYNRVLTTNEMNNLGNWWEANLCGVWADVP